MERNRSGEGKRSGDGRRSGEAFFGRSRVCVAIVEHLIDRGFCSKYRSTKDGRTGLHLTCKYKSGFEVAAFLVQSRRECCNVKDDNQQTALHHAAAGLDSRAVKRLLEQPFIDVNPRNMKNETPVVLAAVNPNDGFEMFLDHESIDRTVKVESLSESLSLIEVAEQRTASANSRLIAENQRILSGSSSRCLSARLEHLAKSHLGDRPQWVTREGH